MAKFFLLLFVACGLQLVSNAQENSPYSRYGLGDIVPNQNIFSRGMGGISAAIQDYQSINFINPATLGSVANTIFEIGAEADIRVLKSANPPASFTSVNSLFSYLQLAFPITPKKLLKKKINWGMSFGLRPVTRINYKIENDQRLPGIDSLQTTYEGSGGVNQAYIGTGIQFDFSKDVNHVNRLSIGFNAGYMFGSKKFSTKLSFVNDTIPYAKSISSDTTHFGGLFIEGGLQYQTSFLNGLLCVGIYGNMQQQLNAKRDIVRETFAYDANGNPYRVDSIQEQRNIAGTIVFPSTIGAGFTYQGKHWLFGLDYETTNWSSYRYYGIADQIQNTWVVRGGAQYFPAKENTPVKKYFNFVRYRAGFYYGPDYVNLNSSRPSYGFTMGTGMPLTSLQRLSYTGEYVVLNTALEIGARGNPSSSVQENVVRFSVGVSMNARWFQKRKYD